MARGDRVVAGPQLPAYRWTQCGWVQPHRWLDHAVCPRPRRRSERARAPLRHAAISR